MEGEYARLLKVYNWERKRENCTDDAASGEDESNQRETGTLVTAMQALWIERSQNRLSRDEKEEGGRDTRHYQKDEQKRSRNATPPGNSARTTTLRTLPAVSCTQSGLATGPQSRDGRCCGVFEVCAAVGGRETRHGGDPRCEAVAVSGLP